MSSQAQNGSGLTVHGEQRTASQINSFTGVTNVANAGSEVTDDAAMPHTTTPNASVLHAAANKRSMAEEHDASPSHKVVVRVAHEGQVKENIESLEKANYHLKEVLVAANLELTTLQGVVQTARPSLLGSVSGTLPGAGGFFDPSPENALFQESQIPVAEEPTVPSAKEEAANTAEDQSVQVARLTQENFSLKQRVESALSIIDTLLQQFHVDDDPRLTATPTFRGYQWRSEAFRNNSWRLVKVDQATTKFFETLVRLDTEGFPKDSLDWDHATFRAHLGLPNSYGIKIDDQKGYTTKAAGAFWTSLLRFQVLDLLLSLAYGVSSSRSPKELPPNGTGPSSLLSALFKWPTYLETLRTEYPKQKDDYVELPRAKTSEEGPEALAPMITLTDMHSATLATKTSKNFQAMGSALMWILECATTDPFKIPVTMNIGDTFDGTDRLFNALPINAVNRDFLTAITLTMNMILVFNPRRSFWYPLTLSGFSCPSRSIANRLHIMSSMLAALNMRGHMWREAHPNGEWATIDLRNIGRHDLDGKHSAVDDIDHDSDSIATKSY
ncbi:hypothetical protein C8F04DRAFT_1184318 [Mycena alexandri]|uniref:Uncharacterized protein n=1 Tax=Mycena alexandri TaxID=1745969 RepID=A0AAD6SSM9_9AGAR|nr:hypothetical protein C8F04DRAFT_1184318 [Mycena alexandri]